jgi:hypothetical protein
MLLVAAYRRSWPWVEKWKVQMLRSVRAHYCKVKLNVYIALLIAIMTVVGGAELCRAQQVPTALGPGATGAPTSTREGFTVHVKIFDENQKPLRQESLVRITSQDTGLVMFRSTRNSETEFANLHTGKYLLEAGAAGYLGMHEQISISDVNLDAKETIVLHRDPAAVDLTLKDAGTLPGRARKQAEKGVQALELSNFQEARKALEAANRQYSQSATINFLIAYLALQQKEPDRELKFLQTATTLDPHHLQAQNLLGQLYYQRGECPQAVAAEEIVLAGDSERLSARKVLASCYLKLKKYEKAREHSQWLVDRGGKEAGPARLLLGQALAGLQKNVEAIEVLRTYLSGDPATSVQKQVQALISVLERRVAQGGDASSDEQFGEPEATEENVAVNIGMPADVDAKQPMVAASVQCPANLLEMASDRSKELVDNVAQFSAIEEMVHESISSQGTPRNRETRKFNYLVSITEPAQGTLVVQEFRDAGILDMPEKISTTGLAVLAIAFHPLFRKDFEMKCEGLGDWNGQAAWLVHFRQFEDKPAHLRTYVVNGANYPVRLKGRAWIAADSNQIIHLETDLVAVVPEIRLMTEHTSVSYGPVQFKKTNSELWLPKSAELYVHFQKHRFHRSESFDHFMLFATDAIDKPKAPAGATQNAPPSDHSGGPRQ